MLFQGSGRRGIERPYKKTRQKLAVGERCVGLSGALPKPA
jgi:hypothetical protein